MKLICYLSNGYPTIAESQEIAEAYVEAGCDIIEIDFPSPNPYLESEYIRNRMAQALSVTADMKDYMEGLKNLKAELPETKFIIMIYEATVKEIGYEAFRDFCLEHGFLDLILVGLENEDIKNQLIADGIQVSCYIQYDLGEEEVASAKASNGFVYLQAKPTTGRINPKYPELSDCIRYLRSEGITAPIYCGVGIYEPPDAEMAKKAGADAVFVGSTILKLYDDRPSLIEKIREMKSMC